MNQEVVDYLLSLNYGKFSEHGDENETIEEIASYGGVDLTLGKNPVEIFYPTTQACPEGYSVVPFNEIPSKFKLRVVGEEKCLGFIQSIQPYIITNQVEHSDWREIIFTADQPSDMWGLDHSIEEQWMRIYDSEVINGKIFNTIKNSVSGEIKDGVSIQGLGDWSTCTNTMNGHERVFRMYAADSSRASEYQRVIIGNSNNQKDKVKFDLRHASFFSYNDGNLQSNKNLRADEATLFEIIPVEEL
eukprot:CAMPEP_0174822894 /NCGR_PEP_ID=MMETSP1107-20130205/19503_1 /TAXON_ID=36770 /ORGANISM="Paraphysomonas vestita, Strain GFlagA" /LENGTH=244 /DNA_ID=CAMNT_0016043285 /DNA_START=675 /DNA_END=1409 /DNA_ORIENTATION=+